MVVPYTVEDDTVVIVSVVGTLVVTVVQDGVEVTVEVCVIVEMPRILLQNGVATFCACMIPMMAETTWH